MPSRTPIIIGVGDIKNRSTKISDAKEPAQLIYEAIQAAILDAASTSPTELQSSIDSIDVVRTWTWPYPDLPGLLAQKLGVEKGLKWNFYSEHGGNQPGRLFDEAARRISRGEVECAVVAGGEALASLSACAAAGKLPPPNWTPPAETVNSVFTPTGRDLGSSMISTLRFALSRTDEPSDLGAIHDIGAPIHVYPLYENGFRAHRGQSLKENHEESAMLYAQFSEVADENEVAWGQGKRETVESVGRVTGRNRMICFPYPLLMNAFNTVNLAAACILTSTTHARALGIPESKWIYPLGGAGTSDSAHFWNRPNFHSAPSISRSIDAALSISNNTRCSIDLVDIYSCFPIVPKLAAQHLGIPIQEGKRLTVLGGLTSFGGAGNNYSIHALTQMTRLLREGKGARALVLANGGVLSYQYVVVLGRRPREGGDYPQKNPLPDVLREGDVECAVGDEVSGDAVVETYTVEFNRDGSPLRGYIVGRLKATGKRFLANHGDEATLRQMAGGTVEIVGKSGW
ncbi:acetyl-CoA acetyltransferase, partial [Clohesyomyces aquaticus]